MTTQAERKRIQRFNKDIATAARHHHESLTTDIGTPYIWFSDMMSMNSSQLDSLILSAKRAKQLKRRQGEIYDNVSDDDTEQPEILKRANAKKNTASQAMIKSYANRAQRYEDEAPAELDKLADEFKCLFG